MDKLEFGLSPSLARSARDGSFPLHRQIADDLRRQITGGDLRPGDSLPSENVLMRRYAVSRGTVRQAIAHLRADGTVTGSQGRRPAVRSPHLTQPLSQLISFSAWVAALGKIPSGKVVDFGVRPVGDETASALGVERGSTVYYLIRVRLADGEPLMIERTSFPPEIGELLAGIDLERESIYATLARQGVAFASASHLIGAIPASRSDADLLSVRPHTALTQVRRHAFSLSGQPLEWSDDRYVGSVHFAVDNSPSDSAFVRRLQ